MAFSYRNVLGLTSVLTRMDLLKMNVKHLSQERLFCESVAHDIKMNVKASRTPRTYEVVLALGFYEQFLVFHATMMPQSGC